jgi:hypothetical protein
MPEVTFKAAVVTAEKNDREAYFQVGLADHPNNPKAYVILQKAFEFDAQDRKTGMDGHYIEINDQSCSSYKGCLRVTLKGNVLELYCDPSRMKDVSKVSIDLGSVQVGRNFTDLMTEILGAAFEFSPN